VSKEEPAGMKRVWGRLWWDIKNLFNQKINPFIDEDNEEPGLLAKRRTAAEDITHAIENVAREGWRNLKRKRK
jgi:hypothetical protein